MNDIQAITAYYKIVYTIVAVVLAGYAWYLAGAARRARASLVALAARDTRG
jgi:hypothetical protein